MAGETVQLIHVCHAYARQAGANGPILNGIDLEVPAGEFVAIHGRSGAGKSTLLYIAGGILPPLSGEVIVGGRDLFRLGDRELSAFRNRMIGFIFQSYYLAPVLTAVENVMVPALLAGYSHPESRKRAGEKLEEVGLTDKAKARPGELSGGQMQRVAIARALVNDPSVLLADEPTGNLDDQTGGVVLALLGRYHRERRLTIIMATHDTNVEMHATQQLYLAGGRLHSRMPQSDGPAAGASSEAGR